MKYGNRKTVIDDIKFDSKDEATFYLDLKEMKRNGEIKNFSLQPKMVLIPSFKKYNKTIKSATYTPDFLVEYPNGEKVYIDVKGFETDASKLRKKMFDYFYPELKLIWLVKNKKYGDKYGWIDSEELKKIKRKNKKEAKERLKNENS